MTLLDDTETAIRSARSSGRLRKSDQGSIEAIRILARKIDCQDEYFQALAKQAAAKNRKPPVQDNVSLPSYLKYADALGLTPFGRARIDAAKAVAKSKIQPAEPKSEGSSLGRLQGIAGGKIG